MTRLRQTVSPLLAGCLALGLAGCATHAADDALAQASSHFQGVRDNTEVLRYAPKDVIRAGESLARAERLSGYWGANDDVRHYAYLSSRYSEIALAHSEAAANQDKLQKQQLERERLQLALRESKLLSVQRQGQWLEDQLLALATTDADRGLVLTLGDVLFDTGEADLKPSANRTLLKLVQFLQVNPKRVIRIEGYTDSTGAAEENLKLSRDRAQAVADMLVDLGIEEKRIEVEGYGDQYPVEANATERGRALNRRVEIVISDRQGALGQKR
ncbi:OmpA family protein [Pseudomonas sp. RIT-PI-S]|uniref:OmpA family protein n=1 Tax=Pseudomonas sp. RIT-PI-S TaxID=3035295 RepID=UPI0021D9E1E6|nr:OmpA family protein [Pseudomonas sp. RIT-PI-S]